MDPIDANLKVAARFHYRADRGPFDSWRILDTTGGSFRGDCEDYALTVLSLIEGGGLLRILGALRSKRASIWFCLDPQGQRHHVLEYRGAGMVDNQAKRWAPRVWYVSKGYQFKHRQPFLICLFRLLLGRMGQ